MAGPQRVYSATTQMSTIAFTRPYVCRGCKKQAQELNRLGHQQHRPVSNQNMPFTEKLRRKIWGTDNPPGLKDPYGGPGFLERRRMNAQQRNAQQQEAVRQEEEEEQEEILPIREEGLDVEEANTSIPHREYQPAETWDGLQHVGHKGHWRDLAPRKGDEYVPWLAPPESKDLSRGELVGHLRSAITETLGKESLGTKSANSTILRTQHGYISHVEKAAVEGESSESPPDDGFLSARFDFKSPKTFKILMRFQQSSGIRLSDPLINTIANPESGSTLMDLITHVRAEPKSRPQTTHAKMMANEALRSQGNVVLLPKRETPVHKEKAVGRWKVIEEELRDRGLPVLGRVNVDV